MSVTFPNETTDYRSARAALLKSEIALRPQMEAVAAELRALPPDGEVPEDYLFDSIGADGAPSKVRLSDLFRHGDTVMPYTGLSARESSPMASSIRRCCSSEIVFITHFAASDPQLARDPTAARIEADLRGNLI